MSRTLELGLHNFEQEILQGAGVALVDFWASWCMPCRMMGPTVDQVAGKYDGQVKVGKVNVDEHPALARKYGIMSIPTLLIFKDGKPVSQMVGVVSKQELERRIDSLAPTA
ncbi:MAG: thioredoxin [Firmicutes bacterium]|nr:thioredoxin [Bacillota bacterium]